MESNMAIYRADIKPRPMQYKIKSVNKYIRLEDIADIVLDKTKVQGYDFFSKSRKHEIVIARHIFCHYAYQATSHSLKTIGRFLGGRDHATIINSKDKYADFYLYDKPFKRLADIVNEAIVMQFGELTMIQRRTDK